MSINSGRCPRWRIEQVPLKTLLVAPPRHDGVYKLTSNPFYVTCFTPYRYGMFLALLTLCRINEGNIVVLGVLPIVYI